MMVEGAVIHYVGSGQIARANHAECDTQVAGIVAYHERNGYRTGGAYNVHRCQHGGRWLHYLGPNQATGDTWANLHLHAICAVIGDADIPTTILLAALAEEIDMVPGARQSVTPHSNWFNTSCCGDPLRTWIAAGAQAPEGDDMPLTDQDVERVTASVLQALNGQREDYNANGVANLRTLLNQLSGAFPAPGVPNTADVLAAIDSVPGGSGGGLSEDDIRSIVRDELAKKDWR
jgi:hypothetical protein